MHGNGGVDGKMAHIVVDIAECTVPLPVIQGEERKVDVTVLQGSGVFCVFAHHGESLQFVHALPEPQVQIPCMIYGFSVTGDKVSHTAVRGAECADGAFPDGQLLVMLHGVVCRYSIMLRKRAGDVMRKDVLHMGMGGTYTEYGTVHMVRMMMAGKYQQCFVWG